MALVSGIAFIREGGMKSISRKEQLIGVYMFSMVLDSEEVARQKF